ncbi:hypothetical protein [Flavobacterium helocola]|uniref:Uncharacterized protein n=1 Tax=Flavobacterium helocola TaxID=3139139 RepID=A0ABU9I7M4_9FLAO
MKIRNIHNNSELSITYKEWKNDFLKYGKHENFEIFDYSGLLELYLIDKNDGKAKFSQVLDKDFAIKIAKQEPDRMFTKELEFIYYDKKLLSINNISDESKSISEKAKNFKTINISSLIDKALKHPFVSGLLLVLITVLFNSKRVMNFINKIIDNL